MSGDGVFHWYWGLGEAPEQWHGPFDTADLALAAARTDQPTASLTVVKADRCVPTVKGLFDGHDVLARFWELNAGIWAEDPANIAIADFEKQDLAEKLADCLHRWVRKHSLDERTMLWSIMTKDHFRAVESSNV